MQDHDPEQAERLLALATQQPWQRVLALTLRAQILLERKAYGRALELLQRAYQVEPDNQNLKKY